MISFRIEYQDTSVWTRYKDRRVRDHDELGLLENQFPPAAGLWAFNRKLKFRLLPNRQNLFAEWQFGRGSLREEQAPQFRFRDEATSLPEDSL